MIYMDYAANTPTDTKVLHEFCKLGTEYIGNPNSSHALGEAARAKLSSITQAVSSLLGVKPDEIIYTSGASESNNLAIKGIARSSRHNGKHILTTCLEHSSVSGTLTYLQEQGYEIEMIDILPDGTVDLEHMEELLREDTILVTICAVDSELGTVQPLLKVAELLKQYPNCKFHVDATQAIGKCQFQFDKLDTVSFTPHKFYGLNGCGILYKRKGLELEPLIHGGASTTIYRSGTPAVALAGSIEIALRLAISDLEMRYAYVQTLNNDLRTYLQRFPKVRMNSSSKALPFILNLSVKDIKATLFQNTLNDHNICISVKSACSVEDTPSRPVLAVSHDRKNAMSSWRISLSHLTTQEEIEEFKSIFQLCYRELVK